MERIARTFLASRLRDLETEAGEGSDTPGEVDVIWQAVKPDTARRTERSARLRSLCPARLRCRDPAWNMEKEGAKPLP